MLDGFSVVWIFARMEFLSYRMDFMQNTDFVDGLFPWFPFLVTEHIPGSSLMYGFPAFITFAFDL